MYKNYFFYIREYIPVFLLLSLVFLFSSFIFSIYFNCPINLSITIFSGMVAVILGIWANDRFVVMKFEIVKVEINKHIKFLIKNNTKEELRIKGITFVFKKEKGKEEVDLMACSEILLVKTPSCIKIISPLNQKTIIYETIYGSFERGFKKLIKGAIDDELEVKFLNKIRVYSNFGNEDFILETSIIKKINNLIKEVKKEQK